MRFLGIRLVADRGGDVALRMAIKRLWAMPLALLPFGLGFFAILVSPRRQGWHDRVARTVVIYDESSAPWSGIEGGRPQLRGRSRRHSGHRRAEGAGAAD